MTATSYQGLIVWQKSIDLVENIYTLTSMLPKNEMYGLASQMQRAAVAIPSNIAEGKLRLHSKEYRQFLSIALGSAAELETQLLICQRIYSLQNSQATNILTSINEVKKMLFTLIQKLEN